MRQCLGRNFKWLRGLREVEGGWGGGEGGGLITGESVWQTVKWDILPAKTRANRQNGVWGKASHNLRVGAASEALKRGCVEPIWRVPGLYLVATPILPPFSQSPGIIKTPVRTSSKVWLSLFCNFPHSLGQPVNKFLMSKPAALTDHG